MQRMHSCNTYFHTTAIMITTLIIQLMCSIQAFRGRNLPNVMNDGIILTYLAFTLTMVFGVTLLIVNFQPQEKREVFQSGAISLSTLIVSMLMYGQKAFRMIIYPQKNTKEFFREQRLSNMQQTAAETIEIR